MTGLLVKRVAATLKGGYDLQETNLGPVSVSGWEGFPLRKHRYHKLGGYSALAIMLNPTQEQLATWLMKDLSG